MLYRNKQELLTLLRENNLWTEKKLGQNFLVNPDIVKKTVAAASVEKSDYIIEVGPGIGILTEELLQKAGQVHAIELDRNIIPWLEKKFGSNPTFKLEKGNVLKARLPSFPYKLVANIPYYITSPILRHFLQAKDGGMRPKMIVLMIQREVAEKICAKTGEHNMLSLQTQIFGKPEIMFNVPKANFFPAPKVGSAVIRIKTYETPLVTSPDYFLRMIGAAFHQKRKTLCNTMMNFTGRPRTEIEAALAGIQKMARPQDLTIEQWEIFQQRLLSNNAC